MAENLEKKRKRTGDLTSRPKKKVAVAQLALPQTLRVTSAQVDSGCSPVIATTPGLEIQTSTQFQAYSGSRDAPSKKHRKAANPELMLHSSTHRTLDYTAKEDAIGGQQSHLRHYVGVFDPKTGQLKVIEAKKMSVRGTVRAQRAQEEDMDERLISKTMMELRNDLGNTFGTKKAKKALASITENAIAPNKALKDAGANPRKLDASSKAMMAQIGEATMGMATREQLQETVDGAKPIPRGDFDAEDIQDVYKAEVMIGAEVLNAIPIKDWQDAVKSNTAVQFPYRFLAHNLSKVGSGPNSVQRLRLLRYLHFLLLLSKEARPGKERGVKMIPRQEKLRELLTPAPKSVIESIRRKFSRNGEMRKFDTDLLRTHVCAIAMIIENFELDTFDIKNDMGLDDAQMAQYFREIGARVKKATGKEKGVTGQVAKLSIPLEFPKVRFQRRR